MIPQEKSTAVTRGLREAFGVAAFEDIRAMTAGLSSALVFRIVVGGTSYLLRVTTRTDAFGDPTRQFACMKSAAEAGLAPRVWYANIEDRLCITDFVETVRFSESQARALMPGVLRSLHALPPFPNELNYVTVDKTIRKFQASNVLPKGDVEEAFSRYDQLSAVYPRHDSDMVSCHCDLKPENILFDGDRVWLVDWEAAHVNDRYFDLAIVANFVVSSEAEERAYLQAYFGRPADEYQLARFFLMRQVLHMMYAAFFLLLGNPADENDTLPAFRNFHRRIWAGEIDLADNEMKTVYGRVHWEQLLHNVRQPRFEEAIRIVADRNAREGASPLLPVVSA